MKHGAIEPLGNVGLIHCLQSSQQPYQVSKKCHFLAGAGTSGYLGDLVKRNSPHSTGIAGLSDGKYLAWLLAWKGYYKFNPEIPYKRFQQSKL